MIPATENKHILLIRHTIYLKDTCKTCAAPQTLFFLKKKSLSHLKEMKRKIIHGICPPASRGGPAAAVQVAAGGFIASACTVERRSSCGIPSIVHSIVSQVRAVGWVPRFPGWVTDIHRATGKVSHLRITQSGAGCAKKAKGADGKQTGSREGGCPFHALWITREGGRDGAFGAGEKEKLHVFGPVECFG